MISLMTNTLSKNFKTILVTSEEQPKLAVFQPATTSTNITGITLTASGKAYLDSLGMTGYTLEYDYTKQTVVASGFINGAYAFVTLLSSDYTFTTQSVTTSSGYLLKAQPSYYKQDPDIGWNAAARSVKGIKGDGMATFRVKGDVTGAIIGLNEVGESPIVHYANIDTAALFTQGQYRPVEHGVQVSGFGSYLETDVFALVRNNGVTKLFKNGSLVYTYSLSATGDAVLDVCLYSAPDAIYDATIVDGVNHGTATASVTATMSGPTKGTASAAATASAKVSRVSTDDSVILFSTGPGIATATAQAAVNPRVYNVNLNASATASAAALDGAQGGATVGGMAVFGADTGLAEGNSLMGGIETDGTNVEIPLTLTLGHATLGGIVTAGYSLTGGSTTGTGDQLVGGMDVFGADTAGYADANTFVGGIEVRGGTFETVANYATIGLWKTELIAYGHEQLPNSVEGTIWTTSIESYGGGQVQGTEWVTTPTITGTMDVYGTVVGKIWKTTLTASGTVGATIGADVTSRLNKGGLKAYGGAQATLGTWKSSFTISSLVGATGSVTGKIWKTSLVATVSQPAFGVVTGTLWKTLPLYGIVNGSVWKTSLSSHIAIASTRGNAYSMNIRTAETTQYTNYGFDYIVRFNGDYYGIKADGRYLLQGASDDGTNIDVTVKTAMTDFGTERHKRVPFAYLDSDTITTITPYVDGVQKSVHASKFGGRRTQLGRGNKGRFWEFELTNESGGDFKVGGVELLEEVLSRRV